MDHVPQATRSPHPTVKVPFLLSETSQHMNLNREGIHVEVGFNNSGEPLLEITSNDGAPREILSTTIDIMSFYQARCFFGLLEATYSAAGKVLDIETYVDRSDKKQVLLTTKDLLAKLEAIFVQQATLTDDVKIDKYVQIDKSMQATDTLTVIFQKYVVDRLETLQGTAEASDQNLKSDLWMIQVITESTAMLRETILTAARQTYLPSNSVHASILAPIFGHDLPLAPDNIFCMDRFKKAGWCPRHAAEAENRGLQSRSVLFSLSSIDRKGISYGNHSLCSTDRCVLDNIDNDTYKPLHTLECGEDGCPMVPAEGKTRGSNPATIIKRSVRSNCIPVISVAEKSSSGIWLSIKSYRPCDKTNEPSPGNRTSSDVMPWESFRESLMEAKVVRLCDDPVKYEASQERGSENAELETRMPLRNVFDTAIGVGTRDNRLPYIAISHVWSQGLGNRRSNALPLCQLRRLQCFVDSLVPPDCRPMQFWIDTICVPLDPVARDAAIKAMRTVYCDAMAVLVIDSTLTEFDLSSIKSGKSTNSGLKTWQVESLMRIKATPWAQRLWTYHEACLAQKLYFQIGGNVVPAMWSLDIVRIEGYIAADVQRLLEDEKAAESARKVKSTVASTEAMDTSSNLQVLLMPLEYTSGYFLVEAAALQLFGKSSPDSVAQEFRDDLRYLSRQLALRTTSRFQDEAICLSNLLGLEPGLVLSDARGKAIPDEERMRRLWEVLEPEKVPAGILFCNRPTYEKQGSGWMPKSLLRDDMGNWIDGLGYENALQKDQNLGILVEMGGVSFEIEDLEGNNSSPWNVLLNVAGFKYRTLEMEASAEVPEWRSSVNTGRFAILMPQSEIKALLEDVEYRVEGLGSHTSQLPYGLLVYLLDDPEVWTVGFGQLDRDSAANTFYVCRREMVELEIVLEDEDSSSIVPAADSKCDEDDQMEETEPVEDDTTTEETIVEVQILSETQKWWVG